MLGVQEIAQVCHETNKAFCHVTGDNSQPSWNEAPEWQRKSAIQGVEFHLDRLKRGVAVEPSASHESWLAEKERDGWKYGPVKDPEKKEHPCFLPYDELPILQRLKDYLFGAVVDAFWKAENAAAAVNPHPAKREVSESKIDWHPKKKHKE